MKPKFKAGDYVMAKKSFPGCFTKGKIYRVSRYIHYHRIVGIEKDDNGDDNGWTIEYFDNVTVSEIIKQILEEK